MGTTCPNIPLPVSTNELKRTSSSSSSLNRSIQALICSKSLSGSIVVVAMSLATKKWKQSILICSRNEWYITTPSLTKKHYRLYYRSINKLQLVVEHCSTVSCRRAAVCHGTTRRLDSLRLYDDIMRVASITPLSTRKVASEKRNTTV